MNNKTFWNKLAGSYDKNSAKVYAKAYTDTLKLTKKYINNNSVILDFACGTGIITIPISNVAKKVFAVDISDNMIQKAKEKCEVEKIDNIVFITGDISNTYVGERKYDVVLAHNIFCYLDDINCYLNKIKDLLVEGGYLISVTDCLQEGSGIKNTLIKLMCKLNIIPNMKFYTKKELLNEIEKTGFNIIETSVLFDNPPNYFIVARL